MMIENLIDELIALGVHLHVQGDELMVQGAKERLTPSLIGKLKANKPALMEFLRPPVNGHDLLSDIPLAEKQDDYPLSSSQLRIWLLSQFEEGNIAYNMPGVFEMQGALDTAALRIAFTDLIERHESLRTVFREDAQGEIKQVVRSANNTGFVLHVHDLRNETAQRERLEQLITTAFTHPFDLAGGPLLSASLYQVDTNKWVFGFVMHHIIGDGWSFDVLIKELFLLYEARCAGAPAPLPPLRIQYKDYAVWQQQQLSTPAFNTHKAYWLGQLNGEVPVLDLHGDHPRPAIKTYNGGLVSRTLGANLLKGIRALAQQQGGTLFMGLLALTKTLLHRYSGQEDILVGTPVAGRAHADLQDQIGFYVNTLVLRSRFSRNDSFSQLLGHVKQLTLEAYKHEAYPFDELVNSLHLGRDLSRNPLFDVMVVLQNAGGAVDDIQQYVHGINISPYKKEEQQSSKFDLAFSFEETGDMLQVNIEYNNDIYNRTTAEQLIKHFEQLATVVVASPDKPISQLSFLSQEEQRQLIRGFNDTECPYPADKTVVQLFEERVELVPGNIALVDGDTTLSYQQLNDRANCFAAFLVEQYHIQPGDLVGIELERSEALLVSIFAVLKCGAAYVPVDPAYPRDRIVYIINDSQCKLLINKELVEEFLSEEDKYTAANPGIVVAPIDTAFAIYTSGSTGLPKGSTIPGRAIVNLCHWFMTQFDFSEKDRSTLSAGVSFDASAWEIFPAMLGGATLFIVPEETRYDVHALSAYYEANNITVSFLTTQLGEQFVSSEDNKSLRLLTLGGDKLNTYARRDYAIMNVYGPSENTVLTTAYVVEEYSHNIPIGKPISNESVYILSEDMQLQPIGVTGEICIAGVGLADGYLNRPELTKEKFVSHPFTPGEKLYRSGDLGRWLPDGNIEFIGRRDTQVKIRGFRIETGEIEAVLQQHAAISSAVVTARVSRRGDKELVAYIVSKEPVDIAELRNFLGNTLPGYMIPAYFVPLTELPFNANGKVEKQRLPDPEGLGLTTSEAYMAPRNETEEKLVAIWKEILGHERIGVRDNFFEMGGHSLNATKMASKVIHVFHVKISIQNVFKNPTIEHLSEQILFVLDQNDRKKEKERLTEIEL